MTGLQELTSGVLAAALVLTGTTNIIVQVLKTLLPASLPTSLLALLVAMAVTLTAFAAYCAVAAVQPAWYMTAGAVGLGLFVAYGAMFGFDKLKEALERFRM